ncbi:hypothetical protein NMY22_g6189 [Coprinellus aureogranulatus]|nr:hypothetical protein NMY22_g6189 [Coprinellus aureogranulatus]
MCAMPATYGLPHERRRGTDVLTTPTRRCFVLCSPKVYPKSKVYARNLARSLLDSSPSERSRVRKLASSIALPRSGTVDTNTHVSIGPVAPLRSSQKCSHYAHNTVPRLEVLPGDSAQPATVQAGEGASKVAESSFPVVAGAGSGLPPAPLSIMNPPHMPAIEPFDRYFYQRARVRRFDPDAPRPSNFELLLDVTSSTGAGVTTRRFGELFVRCTECECYCYQDAQAKHVCGGPVVTSESLNLCSLPGYKLVDTLTAGGGGGLTKGELEKVFVLCVECERVLLGFYQSSHVCNPDVEQDS